MSCWWELQRVGVRGLYAQLGGASRRARAGGRGENRGSAPSCGRDGTRVGEAGSRANRRRDGGGSSCLTFFSIRAWTTVPCSGWVGFGLAALMGSVKYVADENDRNLRGGGGGGGRNRNRTKDVPVVTGTWTQYSVPPKNRGLGHYSLLYQQVVIMLAACYAFCSKSEVQQYIRGNNQSESTWRGSLSRNRVHQHQIYIITRPSKQRLIN